ncbi:N-terminal glutamine amidase-domain-containing protein [Mycena rebaudengoi]|nr:N-terminal glutamine amidase-domain-containing protein [Mycena rebaudengoi]
MTTSLPPFLPETMSPNIYRLCEAFIVRQQDVSAIFISNESKTVVLWNQRQAKNGQPFVIWDYHVTTRSGFTDFDTSLPLPCPLKDYLRQTFQEDVPNSYQSSFRVVPGQIFIENFASDRSHMLQPGCSDESESLKSYQAPPPLYDPLRGSRATLSNNLMKSFVSMTSSEETFGRVYIQ